MAAVSEVVAASATVDTLQLAAAVVQKLLVNGAHADPDVCCIRPGG